MTPHKYGFWYKYGIVIIPATDEFTNSDATSAAGPAYRHVDSRSSFATTWISLSDIHKSFLCGSMVQYPLLESLQHLFFVLLVAPRGKKQMLWGLLGESVVLFAA